MYFSKIFYKKGLALPAKKHSWHASKMADNLSFQITYSSLIHTDQMMKITRSRDVTQQEDSGYSFMLRSRNQTTNQILRSYKNDGFDWPFDLVIVT